MKLLLTMWTGIGMKFSVEASLCKKIRTIIDNPPKLNVHVAIPIWHISRSLDNVWDDETN